ncbi:MAG: IPT/TIG domain-containing protein, partial [Bryobacteraceae bacterium]
MMMRKTLVLAGFVALLIALAWGQVGGPPAINSLTPATATAGGPSFSMTITGSNLPQDSVAVWGANQTPIQSNWISPNQVIAVVPAALIAQAGQFQVAIRYQTSRTTFGFTNGLTFVVTSTFAIATSCPLPMGFVGTSYEVVLQAAGGSAQSWYIESGALPEGLTLTGSGIISGIPMGAGDFSFVIAAVDAQKTVARKPCSVTIASSSLRLDSISPAVVATGTPNFVLTLNGTGFDSTATLLW